MDNYKVVQIIQSLDSYSLNRLQKFIHSPYFNVNEKITSFFDYIYGQLKNKISFSLSDEMVYQIIYNQTTFENVKFRKIRNDLLQKVEEFLAIENATKEPFFVQKNLTNYLAENPKPFLNKTTIKKTQTLLSKYSEIFSSKKYLATFQIRKYEQRFTSDFEKKKRSKKSNKYIDEISIHLDKFYLFEKLKFYSEFLGGQMINPTDQDVLFFKQVEQMVFHPSMKFEYAILGYYYLCQTIMIPDDLKLFKALENLVNDNFDNFEDEDQKRFLNGLINYCIRKANAGDKSFIIKEFEFYKSYIDTDAFLHEGYLPLAIFRNIVFSGLRLNQLDWVREFIQNDTSKLAPELRINAASFNLARLSWYEKNYQGVLDELTGVEYEDGNYNRSSKVLLAAAYYELDETNVLSSHLAAYRAYLNRVKNVNQSTLRAHKNFISYLKKISNVRPNDQVRILKIKTDLEQTKGVVNKDWLLEKVSELQKK